MKIGIYGGTFSPVHNGHIAMAKAFLNQTDIDKLYIIPTFLPPHKQSVEGASVGNRVNMLTLAFDGICRTEISDIEIKRKKVSYTIDTLRSLACEGELYLLCGSDMFLSLETWREADEIFKLANICVGRRETDTQIGKEIREYKAELEKRKNIKIKELYFDAVELSSSQIREMVKNGGDISKYVPSEVERYIRENNLYKI